MTVDERNEWIANNINFIYKVCSKWKYRYDYEDVCQEAIVGAISALDKVDRDKDEKVIRAYVSKYIDGYVMNNCIKKECPVYVPRHHYDNGVRPEVISLDYELEGEETVGSTYVPYIEPGYDEAETMADLMNCISVMTDTLQRTALMLYEGYTRKEIAEHDHCSSNAIFLRVQQLKSACKSLCA